MGTEQTKRLRRWFRAALVVGAALALVVLVNSVTNYTFISRRVAIEQLRREMARTAVALDARVQQHGSIDRHRLAEIVAELRAGSSNIAWIEARTRDRQLTARDGVAAAPAFTDDKIRTLLRNRQPVTAVKTVNGEELVVDLMPMRLAGHPGHVEIAMWLDGASVALWPLRRNFIINSSAAVALLICLTVMALRFRSWVRGRELENELEIARSVQDALLPAREQNLAGMSAATECVPFAGVSGDLHDVFETANGSIALVAGDVSGKGLPAALLMGVIHGTVRSGTWYESASSHTNATERLNRLLCERAGSSRFASLIWAAYDVRRSKLRYVNAGHCRPLLVRESGEIRTLDEGGPVLGLLPKARYTASEVEMDAGDILVLYSDGLVEAANGRGEDFGEDGVRLAIERSGARTSEELRAAILKAAREFTGTTSLSDDLTLVVARCEQTAALVHAA